MADKNLNQVDGGSTSTITGGRMYIILPAGTPSGWQDYYITTSDLLSAVNSLISTNTSAISALDTRVDDLENESLKTRVADTTGFTFNMPADSELTSMTFIKTSGSPIVKVGTSSGADDIVIEHTVTARTTFSIFKAFDLSDTLYVNISGGRVDVVRFEKRNVNT